MRKRKQRGSARLFTRLVTELRGDGSRLSGGKCLWSTHWQRWERHKELLGNVSDAVNYLVDKMLHSHVGGILVVVPITETLSRLASEDPGLIQHKIFQAKWGNDGKPFVRFDGVIGDYWRRELRKRDPDLIRRLSAFER